MSFLGQEEELRELQDRTRYVFTAVVIGLGLALLCAQQIAARGFFRVVFFIPLMVTPVGVAYTFRMLADMTQGPLSPIWPRPAEPAPPPNRWAALADEFRALLRAARATLRPEPAPFFLTAEERERIEAGIAELRTANAVLLAPKPSRDLAALPTPVLPRALFGAREVAHILAIAIDTADRVSRVVEWRKTMAAGSPSPSRGG